MSEPVTSTRLIRLWGAVMTDDGPVAEVRDVPGGTTIGAILDDDAFRVWSISSIEHLSREGHSRGTPCIPGQPCANCRKAALEWWWEHGRRTKARTWMAATARARSDSDRSWRAADFGPARDDHATALADAVASGWPLVRMCDGHGKTLEWIEVSK